MVLHFGNRAFRPFRRFQLNVFKILNGVVGKVAEQACGSEVEFFVRFVPEGAAKIADLLRNVDFAAAVGMGAAVGKLLPENTVSDLYVSNGIAADKGHAVSPGMIIRTF